MMKEFREKVVLRCHSFMSIDCIQHGCIHDTGPVYAGYVYLTGYWQPPDTQSRTHTRMPFLISQLSKSYRASDWSVCDRSWPLIGWCWTQPGPGSRQWVIISAFGLDLAAMPNINRIYRLVQAEEWNITIVFCSECVGPPCLPAAP